MLHIFNQQYYIPYFEISFAIEPFLPLQKIGKKFFGPTSPELIGKKLYLSPMPTGVTAIVSNVPGGKLRFPLSTSRWLGVKGSSSESWSINGTKGLEFKIPSTSVIKVTKPSSVGVRFDNVFVGHSVRGFVKNSGPSNRFFISLELPRMPREARSAGFKFDGTWRQQSSSVFYSMIAKRLATNTGKRFVLLFMQ